MRTLFFLLLFTRSVTAQVEIIVTLDDISGQGVVPQEFLISYSNILYTYSDGYTDLGGRASLCRVSNLKTTYDNVFNGTRVDYYGGKIRMYFIPETKKIILHLRNGGAVSTIEPYPVNISDKILVNGKPVKWFNENGNESDVLWKWLTSEPIEVKGELK